MTDVNPAPDPVAPGIYQSTKQYIAVLVYRALQVHASRVPQWMPDCDINLRIRNGKWLTTIHVVEDIAAN